MNNEVAWIEIADAIGAALKDSSVAMAQRREFAQNMATSYIALIRQPNPASFAASQTEPIRAMLQQGLKVEMLITALERASEVAKELLDERPATISFATVIAKMVAAQANLQVIGLFY